METLAPYLAPEAITGLVGALGALVGAVGGVISAFFVARKASREDSQALIDQLQEERAAFVTQLEQEREQTRQKHADFERRIDAFWGDKLASRRYVGALTDHIYQRKEPPPPEPPAGYIP